MIKMVNKKVTSLNTSNSALPIKSIVFKQLVIYVKMRDMNFMMMRIFTNIPKKFLRRNLKHKKKSLKKLTHSSKRLKKKSTR